jgi:hypothetical protein
MANKIVIAELDIDVKDLIKSTTEIKKKIQELKDEQKVLQITGKENSEQFVKNTADLKVLTSSFNQNIKAIADNTKATADAIVKEQVMTMALNEEVTSINEAREQNKILTKLRNEANATTAEGIAEIQKLNEKLDQNNAFIKENADAYLKQKINIGNYKDSVIEALEEMQSNKKALEEQKEVLIQLQKEQEKGSDSWNYYNNQINQTNTQINVLITSMGGLNDEQNASSTLTNLLSGNFKALGESAEKAGGAGNLLKSSLSGATSGMMGMVKASLAFIVTPIGAILAAIVLAFALVKNAMSRSEESTNKITKVFTIFSGIVGKLLKFLEPLGEFLIDGIVMGFELAGKAADKALSLISGGLELLGFDNASKSVKGFQVEMQKAAKDASDLADAEANLEKQQRQSQRIQLEYQKNAEKLRQIRDDENLTIAQRTKANEELGVVLKNQLNEELKIAELALKVANLRIKAEGQTKETLDAQAEALTTISDIQERITGQESEQLVNRVALQKEANEKAKELRDKRIEQEVNASRQSIDLFVAEQGFRKKSAQEEYNFNKDILDRELKDLVLRYKRGKISKLEYETEKLNLSTEFSKASADLLIAEGERELEIIKNNSKLSIDAKLQAELDYQALRLEQGIINEQQYQDAISKVQSEYDKLRLDKKLQDEQLEKERKAIDLENKRLGEQITFEEDVEIQRQQNEVKLQEELAQAEKSGADTQLIKDKYAKFDKDLTESVEVAKRLGMAQTFGQLAQLFGEASAIGKIFALTQATITGYEAVLNAYSTAQKSPITLLNPAYPIIQAGIAGAVSGVQIAKIASAKTPKFEDGGIQQIGGKRHSAGGTKFFGEDGTRFEAEAGEGIGILNRNAFGAFMDFNNAFNAGKSSSGLFQGGGIITQAVPSQTDNSSMLISMIENLPAPIVGVADIINSVNDKQKVVNFANHL